MTGLLAAVVAAGTGMAGADVWKFGVMADTQWTGVAADPVNNPNDVAVSIIKQLNPQFIAAGVKFVVQVGDLTENGQPADLAVRAAAAQPLYNAGIGFFPLRGNHETSQAAALAFTNNFPQTRGLGTNGVGATVLGSPDPSSNGNLQGLSYAFDYENVRVVMLDQFARLSGVSPPVNDALVDQIPWISSTLSNRTSGTHAFVFAHKNLIGQNHVDGMFGANPAANPSAQNSFFSVCDQTDVGYVLGGHDHIHQRSRITSPDGLSSVRSIICASDSSKFYTPAVPSLDQTYNSPRRETSVAQDLYRIGYYIFTVNGPHVTVDYYASDETFPSGNSPSPTPPLHFQKRETFGYSLNGNEYAVPQGNSYTNVHESIASGNGFLGTSSAILAGTNASTLKDGSARSLVKTVTTGWSPATTTASDILTLWGMTDLGAAQADTYVLSMSYDPAGLTEPELLSGEFALATQNSFGRWILAVEQNIGGQRQFVFGPWNASYTLGTYGVDTNNSTVWAVLNYTATFAASPVQIAEPGYVAGDFHQHTLHTDGSFQMADVFAKDALYGLSWWANSEHGGNFRSAYRWRDVGGYAIPTGLADHSWGEVKAGRIAHPTKTVIQGLELNCPGHEHVSTAIIADQFPADTNLAPIAEFEYRFDGGDGDTSGGPGGIWTGKSTVNDHTKATNAVAWLQANYPAKSWFVPAHPERANSYTIAHFRDFNNVGPDVAFGFESMPGHQKSSGRGGYSTSAGVPPAPAGQGGTYGGTGVYAAQIGGLWDAMLAEGRGWWLFASSDFHNTSGDFWPGEYQKTYTYVPDVQQANSEEAAQVVADGLRSGNSWVVEGDLIDSLAFSVSNAVMGQTCTVPQGTQVAVSIRVHDPVGPNFNTYSSYTNPALDHIDVIAGSYGEKIAPFLADGVTPNPAYSAISSDARVIARFDAVGGVTDSNGITSVQWTDQGDGWRQMTLPVTVTNSTFLRLRGSNLGLNVVNQTDGAGNPLPDSLLGANTAAMAFDDLWFYSNPIFVRNPAPNIAPTVSITSPTEGGEFLQGMTIPVLASATDADGSIAQVDFYADGALLGSDTTYAYQYNWANAATGTHTLVAVAIDNEGQATTSTVVSITVAAGSTEGGSGINTPALRFSVLSGTDDAEEVKATGFMDLASSDLELVLDGTKNQLVGMRFDNVVIPQGAKILSAYIQFTCDEIGTKNKNPFNVTVKGEASDNASSYTATASNMSARASTTATVAWSNAPDWQIEHEAGIAQRTPDISAVVQEIVSRPGWAEGNALALMMEGQGARVAEAFEGEPTMTPELVVVAVRETSVAVTAGTDDVEELKTNGFMDIDSSDLELIQDGSKNQLIGMRFNNINIPTGTKILNAYLQFTCDEVGSKNINPFSVTICGEATSHALTYTTAASNMSTRARTAAMVAWSNAPDWQIVHEAGVAQRTPDISAVVQEIINRSDWTEGNSLALMIEGQGGRCAEAFEGEPTMTPRLVIQTAVTKEASFGPAASNDDAEENNASGAMDLTSSDIEVIQDKTYNQTIGIRCPGVNLPAGALLLDAWIQFTCDEVGSKNVNPFSVTIRGEATDNAEAFTTTVSNIAVRARTTAAVAWSNAPDWQIEHEAGLAQRTPSILGIVREILARPGWRNGQAMAFLINGQGGRCAEAFDGEPTMPPKLVLVYGGGAQGTTTPPLTLIAPTEGASFPVDVASISVALASNECVGAYLYVNTTMGVTNMTIAMIANLPLQPGQNQIVVSGTNALGYISAATVTVTRASVAERQLTLGLSGSVSVTNAEIVAYDATTKRAFVTCIDKGIQIVDLSVPFAPKVVGTVLQGELVNSVAVKNGIVAAAVENIVRSNRGAVVFMDTNGTVWKRVTVGIQPDMVTFTPDGSKVVTADEAETAEHADYGAGSVSVIDLSSGVASATATTLGFTAFDSQTNALIAAGVRLFPGRLPSVDFEPEYVAIAPDGQTAMVTLQENNAMARIDLNTLTITSILPLGLKDHSLPGNALDASDQDGPTINIANWPVFGMYMPDAVASFSSGGQTYYITANEGDIRDTGSDESRISALNLDAIAFSNAATLQLNANLGRLTASAIDGDVDRDGDIDKLHTYGARSFSIWSATGNLVFDSGDALDQLTAVATPTLFNANDGLTSKFDQRSDDKGCEPEGVKIATINGCTYAFIALERAGGGIMVYDVTAPAAPVFMQYARRDGDVAPEGVEFVSAEESPNGKALLLVANETSQTLTVYEVEAGGHLHVLSGDTTVAASEATYTVTGTAGDIAGAVTWVNEQAGTEGTASVVSGSWSASVPLIYGLNTLTFSGVNAQGVPFSDTVTVTRSAPLPAGGTNVSPAWSSNLATGAVHIAWTTNDWYQFQTASTCLPGELQFRDPFGGTAEPGDGEPVTLTSGATHFRYDALDGVRCIVVEEDADFRARIPLYDMPPTFASPTHDVWVRISYWDAPGNPEWVQNWMLEVSPNNGSVTTPELKGRTHSEEGLITEAYAFTVTGDASDFSLSFSADPDLSIFNAAYVNEVTVDTRVTAPLRITSPAEGDTVASSTEYATVTALTDGLIGLLTYHNESTGQTLTQLASRGRAMIALGYGLNVITVTGTNNQGQPVTATVIITRNAPSPANGTTIAPDWDYRAATGAVHVAWTTNDWYQLQRSNTCLPGTFLYRDPLGGTREPGAGEPDALTQGSTHFRYDAQDGTRCAVVEQNWDLSFWVPCYGSSVAGVPMNQRVWLQVSYWDAPGNPQWIQDWDIAPYVLGANVSTPVLMGRTHGADGLITEAYAFTVTGDAAGFFLDLAATPALSALNPAYLSDVRVDVLAEPGILAHRILTTIEGNGIVSEGNILVAHGASTNIVLTAGEWNRIQSLTTNSAAVAEAAGAQGYTLELTNVTQDYNNRAVFGLRPNNANPNNVSTAWLVSFGRRESVPFVTTDRSLGDKYLLNLDPYEKADVLFDITDLVVTGGVAEVTVRLKVDGADHPTINGQLSLESRSTLTTDWALEASTPITGTVFQNGLHRYVIPAGTNGFFRALVR